MSKKRKTEERKPIELVISVVVKGDMIYLKASKRFYIPQTTFERYNFIEKCYTFC